MLRVIGLSLALAALAAVACDDNGGTTGSDGKVDGVQNADGTPGDGAEGDGAKGDLAQNDVSTRDGPKGGDGGACGSGYFHVIAQGKSTCKKLPATVTLPVDSAAEADAVKQASGCTCSCYGGWTQKGNAWVCTCCQRYPDCEVEVKATTAQTKCEYFG